MDRRSRPDAGATRSALTTCRRDPRGDCCGEGGMIHINVQRIPRHEIDHLIKAAEKAQKQINAEKNPDRRRDLIDKHRPKWVAFRKPFHDLSHGKCWYTESINPGTDDDVDHFRPKARL